MESLRFPLLLREKVILTTTPFQGGGNEFDSPIAPFMSGKTKPWLRRLSLFHRTYERSPILVLNTKIYTIIYSNRSMLLLIHEKFHRIREGRNEKEGFDQEIARILKIFSRRYYWHCFSSRIEGEGMKVFHRTYERSPILSLSTELMKDCRS